jgi:hypothetical protein
MRVGAAAVAVLLLAGCGGGPSFGERLQRDLARTRAFKLRPEPRALAHAQDELTAAANDLEAAPVPAEAAGDVLVVVATWRWLAELVASIRRPSPPGIDPEQQLDAYFAALADLRRQGYVLRRP